MMVRAGKLDCVNTGADLAALLTERDILSRGAGPDVSGRLDILQAWREGREVESDIWALRTVDRTSRHLAGMMTKTERGAARTDVDPDLVPRLLLCVFPDRIARLREGGGGRFVLAQGRGVQLSPVSSLGRSPFIVAVKADAGEQGEGKVHLAAAVTERLIRREYAECIETLRRVEWDKRENRIAGVVEERLGGVVLSSKTFFPSAEESAPFICEAIRSDPGMLSFSREVRQFQGRIALMRKLYPEETWPDLTDGHLLSTIEEWLLPQVNGGGLRSKEDIARLDILPALRQKLDWKKSRLLEDRLPEAVIVPSGTASSLIIPRATYLFLL